MKSRGSGIVLNAKLLRLLLVLLIVSLPLFSAVYVTDAQEFPHVEASKTVNPTQTQKDATLQVTILLRGAGGSIQSPVDVVLIIDKSGSMTGKKIADAKAAAKVFLGYTDERDRVGLVTFSSTVQIVSQLTSMTSTNKDALGKKIDSIAAVGATNIYDAIVAANEMLIEAPRSGAPLVEVLLTDGIHNWPSVLPDSAFQDLADQAKSNDIIIYTIGLGSDVSANRLRLIADTTGGTYYFAATSDQLRSIYQDIGSKLAFAGTNIKVTETVPSYLTYNGDASKEPTITSSGDATILEWRVGSLKVGEEWQVSYTARAQKAVEAVSTVVQCKVEYMTSEAASAILNLTPGIVFHDVAVTKLTAVPDIVDKGGLIALEITVQNLGIARDTFDLKTSYNGAVLDSRSIALDSGESTVINIQWNTSMVDAGKYIVTVEADPDQRLWEANRDDNMATANVEILSAAGVSIFLLVAMLVIITAAVAGTAYGKSRLTSHTHGRLRQTGTTYRCSVDGSSLKYSYITRQWHCSVCGTRYKFP